MEQQKSREFLEAPAFKDELSTIVSTPLSAENIDSYADDALNELVTLVEKTTHTYEARPTITFTTRREQEEAAFGYFGLQNVEAILDHIAEKSDEIHKLDDYIASIEIKDQIFLPPDESELPELSNAAGSEREKRIVPRLKTLLFVLTNQYDIDLSKENDITISKGVIDESMMRDESYYSVVLPTLQRQVFINDEIGNATYIFNTEIIDQLTASSDLQNNTKSRLNDLIASDHRVGQRLIYSDNFVVNLMAAIDDPTSHTATNAPSTPNRREAPSFLLPNRAPEGWLTGSALQRRFGVSMSPFKNILEEYAEEIGQISSFRSKGRGGVVPYYSQEQQALFEKGFAERGLLNGVAPEGYKNQKALTEEWNINAGQITNAVLDLTDELGKITVYQLQTKGAPRPFFSPVQVELIHGYLEKKGVLSQLPEGYVFMRDFATELGVSEQTVEKAIGTISDIGKIESYWASVRTALSLSPLQQQKIHEHLAAKGFFNQAPEGYLPQSEFTKILGVDHRTLKEILANPDLDIGTIEQFKYGDHLLKCFSPLQQSVIIAFARQHKQQLDPMPEGYRSIGGIAKDVNISHQSVTRAVEATRSELGSTGVYSVRHQAIEGFSSAQQQRIKDRLYETTGYGKPDMPEDYLSFHQFAVTFQMHDTTLSRLINESPLDITFGEYRDKVGRKIRAVSPEQQATIRIYIQGRPQ